MILEDFVASRRSDWDRLQELIGYARGKPDRLGSDGVLELGMLYRAVVADFAQARRWFPTDPTTQRLGSMAVSARQLVYDAELRRRRPWRFLSRTYWQVLRSRPAPIVVAAVCLLLPALLVAVWSLDDPAATAGFVPAEFRNVLEPGTQGTDGGMSAGEQAAFSTFLITHNIQVSILAFAAGVFWCVGGLFILLINGLTLGAVGGILIESGHGGFFVELVAAHGVLELSAVIIGAAAGLRMGWALVDPGWRTRREALVSEARAAVMIVVGTMPWFVLAGIIEAFVSRRGLPAVPMAITGLIVGGLFWLLVVVRGKADDSETEPAGATW